MRTLGLIAAAICLAAALPAQKKYAGPKPAKTDVPYLQHANNLVETEAGEAKEEDRKDWKAFVLPAASSPARTPLAEPIFLMSSDKITPEKLRVYKLEVKNGRREVLFPNNPKKVKDAPKPYRLAITRLEPGLFKMEVNHGSGLDIGEYCLSPEESNQVFCFSVY